MAIRAPAQNVSPGQRVVLVHGMFYGRLSMRSLANRLLRAGYSVRRFGYRPSRDGLDAAEALLRLMDQEPGPVHLVGHSFGGLVIARAVSAADAGWRGRVVLLGSPLRGSRVARRLLRWWPGRMLLGRAGPPLRSGIEPVPKGVEVGLIAGQALLGLGRLTGPTGPSDGTIAVDEVRMEGAADRRVLPVSHTGMLFSGQVAAEVVHFLCNGRFGAEEMGSR